MTRYLVAEDVERHAQAVLAYVLKQHEEGGENWQDRLGLGDAIEEVTGIQFDANKGPGDLCNPHWTQIKRRFVQLFEQHRWPDGNKGQRQGSEYDHMYKSIVPDLPKEEIVEDYTEEKLSLNKLAAKYGHARTTIRKALVAWGVPIDSKRRSKRSMKNVPSPFRDVTIGPQT